MNCDLNSSRVLVVYISFVGSLQEFLFVVLATIFTLYILCFRVDVMLPTNPYLDLDLEETWRLYDI